MAVNQFFDQLSGYYQGFYLEEPVGNNAFSFEERRHKKLYIPKVIRGDLTDVSIGDEIVFSEIFQGQERNCRGLRNFVYWQHAGKEIIIFDNHHHAFAFWAFGLMAKKIAPGSRLVHVDQHKDLRQAPRYLEKGFWTSIPLDQVCAYVNQDLNVGNFIDPALRAGIFCEAIMVDHQDAFQQRIEGEIVLDIDLDVFSPEMGYISDDDKISYITLNDEFIMGVIISDKHIFQMHKCLFEIMWKNTKGIQFKK